MDNIEDTEQSGGALRAQLEQALADKKEALAKAEELQNTVRSMQVSSVLSTKGINPKVASFIPSDVEGVEAIGKWLEENADVFSPSQAEAPAEAATDEPVKESPNPVDTANAQRLQSLSGSAGASTMVADFESRLRDASNDAEVQQILVEAQEYILAGS